MEASTAERVSGSIINFTKMLYLNFKPTTCYLTFVRTIFELKVSAPNKKLLCALGLLDYLGLVSTYGVITLFIRRPFFPDTLISTPFHYSENLLLSHIFIIYYG